MNEYKEIADRFARETGDHQITILHDDGLYRHVRFKRPDHGFYWFDLVTWPGKLAFVGDGTGFIFSRVEDMFTFFRSGKTLRINPQYWAEKLFTDRDCAEKYSSALFKQHVAEALTEAEADFPGVTAAWAEHLEYADDIEFEENARDALRDFSFTPPQAKKQDFVPQPVRPKTFRFDDAWEWDLKDWDWWFLWACYAITWGIRQYDEAKKPAVETVELPEAVAR